MALTEENQAQGIYRGWQNRLYDLDQKFHAGQEMTPEELDEGKNLAESLGYTRAVARYNAIIERAVREAQAAYEAVPSYLEQNYTGFTDSGDPNEVEA